MHGATSASRLYQALALEVIVRALVVHVALRVLVLLLRLRLEAALGALLRTSHHTTPTCGWSYMLRRD